MKVSKKFWIFLIIPLTYILLYNLKKDYQITLSKEDGFIEYTGAFAWLIASVMFIYLFITIYDKQFTFLGKSTKRNIYFALLGIIFFLAFGEEISWGQRIFNWNTPEGFKGLNAQKETNFHNLWLFQAYREDGTSKSFFENMLNINRLLNIFWLLFCVVIPTISLISNKGKKIINYLGIPLVPLWIGGFFILNYTVFIFSIYINNHINYIHFLSVDEVKESFYAIGFALLGLHLFKEKD